jgi:hypothetical protein
MKKKLLIVAVMLIVSAAALQAQAFEKGNNVLSAGVGFGNTIGSFSDGAQTPALSAAYERGIFKLGPGVFSAGGYFGYKGFKNSSDYIFIGARAAYHYTGLKVDKLDVYAGVMGYYSVHTGSGIYYYAHRADVVGFAGGRYFFIPSLAAFSELSWGVSIVSVGLSLKF